jgi:putative glutamine amidotransferase
MDKRPRIGITGNHRRWAPAWWCTALALRLCGAIPVRISISHPWTGSLPDALVIGGGNDISPEHYDGEVDAKVKLDPERDELEIMWVRRALEHTIPMVGICRGAQLINVLLGGTLYHDIRHIRRLTYNRPGLLPTKQVWLDSDSGLARITGKTKLRVNSLHHQAVKLPGNKLRCIGRDLDNITQAIESNINCPIIGVQWHPEYLAYLPSQLAIFRWLVNNTDEEVRQTHCR